MKHKTIIKYLALFGLSFLIGHCAAINNGEEKSLDGTVYLPFIKNSPNECYFLDEFMPVPDGVVKGKTGSLSLRYYSYKCANYKDWHRKHIILSFYSQDDRCWSLFEEYYIQE